jgi:hypothetical protein
MNNEEIENLISFYTDEQKKEWDHVISKWPNEILPSDFAHGEFCAAVVRSILLNRLRGNLASDIQAERLWAGVRLYEYWSIEKLFPFNRN